MRVRSPHVFAVLLFACVMLLAAGCGGTADEPPTAEEGEATMTPEPAASPTPTRTPAPADLTETTPEPPPVDHSALEDIRERGELRVGVLYNALPLAGLSDNGTVRGYEADLVRNIAERWGVDVTFTQVTRQTRLAMLYSGEVDMLAAAMPHRRELEQYVEFTNSTFLGGYAVLVRADTAEQGMAILGNGAVGVADSDAVEVLNQQAEVLGFQPNVQSYTDLKEAVQALADVQVNSVVDRRENLIVHAQAEGMTLLDDYLLQEPYAFAVRHGDVALRDLLDLTLQDIIAEGQIGTIFSTAFYGLPADVFPERLGEPSFTFEDFPTDLTQDGSVLERLRGGGPLRVAGLDLADEPAPFDPQVIYDGYNRAVINEMARRWGVPVEEIPQSAGQAGLERVEAGEADLAVGLRSDRSLVGRVALSEPYYTRALGLIHLDDVRIQNVLDLELKPALAAPPTDESQSIIEDNNQLPRVTVVESYQEAYDTLKTRAVYAVVGDEYALMLMAQEDDTLALDERRYRPREYAMVLPRSDPDFLALVNFTLQDMYLDGTLDGLREQYFGPYLPGDAELDELTLEVWPGDGGYLGIGEYVQ